MACGRGGITSRKQVCINRPNRSVAYMNSERSRELIQDLGQLKPDEIPTWKREVGIKSYT